MSLLAEIPGIPDPAKSPDEFALDRRRIADIMLNGRRRFFLHNPEFIDMQQPVETVIARLLARRALRRGDGERVYVDPGCPRCRLTSVAGFERSTAQRFQNKFLAAWTDPVRRPPMVNALTGYCLAEFPEIGDKGLDLVVNVHKLDRSRLRCLLYSPKGRL